MSKMVSRLLVFVFAAAWLVGSICNARNDFLLMSPERVPEKLTFQPIVPFTTAHTTSKRYRNFIKNLRDEMLSGDKVEGIDRLQNKDNFSDDNRYFQVALFSKDGERVLLAIDRVNANVVGYRSRGTVYIFPDIDVPSSVFSGINRKELGFKSSYAAMEVVGRNRTNLGLGMGSLDIYIKLIDQAKTPNASNQAVFLLAASQMVSDAIRYRYVENMVIEHITDEESSSFFPSATMITFEDNWELLSTQIQQSVAHVIDPGFMLPGVSDHPITSIYPILGPQIAFILYVCDDCPKREPTVNIIGRNGLCADVQDSFYYDGNPIILWPCSKNGNQLFTLKNDGTIRCNEKCLTAYQLKEDRYVMIHNCTSAPENSGIKWVIQDNGNIINKEHNLSLNAFVGYQWSLLTVEQISLSSRQAWSFRNSTTNDEPSVTPIISYNGMYMATINNATIQVVKGNGDSVPKWGIYSDGTIRPSTTRLFCLARESADGTNYVDVHLCDGENAERWLIHYVGYSVIISDPTNQYVLEVNKDQKVVVVKGSANESSPEQKFTTDFKFQQVV